MPKISIIMPMYNKAAFLYASLDSLLRQPFLDYELIIVNDGSSDDSDIIAHSYLLENSQIHMISIPNGGVSNARNIGLHYAKGEWIMFLDADDILEEDYLKHAMNTVDNTTIDILFSNFSMVDIDGKCLRTISSGEQGIFNRNQLCDKFMDIQEKNGFFGFISNKLFRKNLLQKAGAKFPTSINLAEDLDFYAQLYPFVSIPCFTNINSFRYLQTERNYVYNERIDYFSQIQVHIDIREWFIKVGEYEKYHDRLNKKISDYVYFTLFYGYENNHKCKAEYQLITQNRLALSCINLSQYSGFKKLILYGVKTEKEWLIENMMWIRMRIRELYRRLR